MKPNHSKKLKEFTEYLKTFPEIIAVLYTGSTATRKWTEYSDLDIDIVVDDKDHAKIIKKIPEFLSWWGDIKFYNNYGGCNEHYAFIGEDYFKIDLDPIKLSELKPCFQAKNIRVGFDKKGVLKEVIDKSKKLKKELPTKKEIKQIFLDVRGNIIYLARYYARGRFFSGVNEITSIRWDLFKVFCSIKNIFDFELSRNAEKLLTKKERQMFEDTSFHSYKKEEVIRAIKACLKLTHYLEKEYEKKFGKLDYNVNDEEILNLAVKAIKRG